MHGAVSFTVPHKFSSGIVLPQQDPLPPGPSFLCRDHQVVILIGGLCVPNYCDCLRRPLSGLKKTIGRMKLFEIAFLWRRWVPPRCHRGATVTQPKVATDAIATPSDKQATLLGADRNDCNRRESCLEVWSRSGELEAMRCLKCCKPVFNEKQWVCSEARFIRWPFSRWRQRGLNSIEMMLDFQKYENKI